MDNTQIIVGLAKARALFQQRAIIAAMGMKHPEKQCAVCGNYHAGEVPFACETGDGE